MKVITVNNAIEVIVIRDPKSRSRTKKAKKLNKTIKTKGAMIVVIIICILRLTTRLHSTTLCLSDISVFRTSDCTMNASMYQFGSLIALVVKLKFGFNNTSFES